MHGLPPLLVSLGPLLGCAGSETLPDDTATDTDPAPIEVCEPTTLTLSQDLREADLPAQASIEHTEHGIALEDFDGDGDLDAMVGWSAGVFGLRNDGTGQLLLDPTMDIDGGAEVVRGTALATADLDQDGDLDLYLGEYPTGDLLLWNDGTGHFTSQRLSEGDPLFSPWSGSFGDADGDGDLDLYVVMLVPNLEPEPVVDGSIQPGPNYLYVNQGGGDFVRDDSRIPQDDPGLTFHGVWVDLDSDGDLDLYDANDWGYYVTPNHYLENDGTGHFSRNADCACEAPMYAMGVAVGDVQGDGLPDLVVTNLNTPTLFENVGGEMVDATRARGVYVPPSETNFTSWGTSFGDFDRNGCSDIAVAFGRLARDVTLDLEGLPVDAVDPEVQANVMLMNDCSGQFTRLADSDFDAFLDRDRAVTVGDVNGDGRVDVVTAGKHFVRVWLAGGGCGNGVTVRLSQPGENPAAIGARVTLTVEDRDQVMWMLPSTTHSTSPLSLTLGLGTAKAGTLSVLWPDGSRTDDVAVHSGEALTVVH